MLGEVQLVGRSKRSGDTHCGLKGRIVRVVGLGVIDLSMSLWEVMSLLLRCLGLHVSFRQASGNNDVVSRALHGSIARNCSWLDGPEQSLLVRPRVP